MVEVVAVEGLPEVRSGDDVALLLEAPLRRTGIRPGDVVCVTQKVVSKAEGRIVPAPEGRAPWIARETRRLVAQRKDLVIAETRHGFVCANAGVDESNVPEGFVALLPEDPDASAERIRDSLVERLRVSLGVIVTDTFGRAWREGVVNVAIGVAGMPAAIDLRGTPDHTGRTLEATVVALADEVAAASGLVMPKAGRVPAAVVRGLSFSRRDGRGPEDDLFRESTLVSIAARADAIVFGAGDVPRHVVEEAVRAACAGSASDSASLVFVALWSTAGKRRLLAAVTPHLEGTSSEDGDRAGGRSGAVLAVAPVLIVPAVRGLTEAARHELNTAERDELMRSSGARIERLLLGLRASGISSSWMPATASCQGDIRMALSLEDDWLPLGVAGAGPAPREGTAGPRIAPDLARHLRVDP
jgi:dehydro coenzyme F420 reductase / coenzyme F420-0:L-glutamate ligase / coenzyme F420-1:gamma-L-glutamate ligase